MNEPGELEPVARESTAALIADRLRSAIMYGTFAPGTQLAESDLASRLGVSRGPLREAMQRLVQEGLLRSAPHRGLFVTSLDVQDVYDIYAARTAVERAACLLILERDPKSAAERLGEVHARMAEAAAQGDRRRLSDADLAFHEALVEASGSLRLERMARTLLIETRMCMAALERRYREPGDLVAEHSAIVDAIRAADEERLLAVLDTHMAEAIDRLSSGSVPNEPAGPAAEEPSQPTAQA